ncbi:MAG: hypothetical protein ACTSQP_22075 [Promethearchaeota archaeon]
MNYKEIVIDVTGSAPRSLKDPGKQLKSVFNDIFKKFKPDSTKILDLGAGRLRNAKYFVEKGFQVYCAEFEELFKKGSAPEKYLKELKKYENFHQLIFPKDIFECDLKFNIIFLINVQTVMPIPIERICLFLIARKLIADRGILIWYSDPMIRNKKQKYSRKFSDGYLTGQNKKNKETFYVELHENEIETMIELTGFKIKYNLSKKLKKYAFRNIVYYAIPKKNIIFSKAVNLAELINKGTYHKDKFYTNDNFKSILELISEELKLTSPGKKDALKYQNLIAHALKIIFEDQLTDMEVETIAWENLIRIDITFRNMAKEGFFHDIRESNSIYCPYILIECKNYSNDIGNPEYSQLENRLGKKIGKFGLLIVRKVKDKKKCIKHCKKILDNNEKYIIVLEDKDIFDLIEAKIYNPNEINKILHKKLKELLFDK